MANDVNFIIGGKDKLTPATRLATKSLGEVGLAASATARTAKSLTQATLNLAAAYAVAQSAFAVASGTHAISEAYQKQVKAVRLLNESLKIRGDISERFTASMVAEAKAIEVATGVLDNQVLALMQQASMLGVIPDRIDDATRAAIGLSRVTGRDLSASLEMVTEALKGNFAAFAGIKPEILWMRTNQEKFAAVMAIVSQGMASQAESLTELDGAAARNNAAWTNLSETLGQLIAPLRLLGLQLFTKVAEVLNALLTPAVENANAVLASMRVAWVNLTPAVTTALNSIIAAFTMAEVVALNLPQVFSAVALQVRLSVLSMVEDLRHALTIQIPAYTVWFAQNYTDLFRDAMSAATTIVLNGVQNARDAFQALWDFIGSGGQTDILAQMGAIAGRSYLDGFTASVSALPEIAARQLTEQEKSLAGRIGQIGMNLGQQFAEKFAQRALTIGDLLEATIDRGVKAGLAKNAMQIDLKAMPSMFAMQGVQAQQGRLLTRGPASTLQQQMVDLMKQQLKVQQDGVRAAGQTSSNTTVSAKEIAKVAVNTANTIQMVPVT